MVLADTSVWIRFFRNQYPYAAELQRLINLGEVTGHDLIYGELLMGDSGGHGRRLAEYSLLEQTPGNVHTEVVAFVRARRLHGRGVGWIDVNLLASAIIAGAKLWTADQSLHRIAVGLGVAYTGR
jgi:predicted nucleic acid-binding protein